MPRAQNSHVSPSCSQEGDDKWTDCKVVHTVPFTADFIMDAIRAQTQEQAENIQDSILISAF